VVVPSISNDNHAPQTKKLCQVVHGMVGQLREFVNGFGGPGKMTGSRVFKVVLLLPNVYLTKNQLFPILGNRS
jgi:hypothetical protein